MNNLPNQPFNTPTTSTTTTTPTIAVAHQNTTQSSAANRPTYTSPSSSHANACAACRFQRRKCTETCPLAPYFPAHNQQQFMNAYKLFGVNNIIKALNSVPPNWRDDAMTALIYTANARAHDPVRGCTRIIESLNSQIAFYNDQLMAVLAQIAALRTASQVDGQVQVLEALPLSTYFSEGVGDSESKQPSIISNEIQAQQQRRLHENLLQDNQPIADFINEAETANQLKLENTDVQVQNVDAKIKFEYTSDENPEPRTVEQKPAKRRSEARFEEPENKRNPFDAFDLPGYY